LGGEAQYQRLPAGGEGRDNMNWKILKQRLSLNIISAIILVVGLGSAALIYQKAVKESYGAGEDVQLMMQTNSKLFRHNLEVFGGKLNVMMYDFRTWFAGLWQGKSLAFIIAGSAVIISLVIFCAANYLPRRLESDVPQENDPEATD
jgi:ABC-type phosphate/phosphonate transport system permease subunit